MRKIVKIVTALAAGIAALALLPSPQAAAQFGMSCPGQWVNAGGGSMCQCPDGSYANMAGGQISCPQPRPACQPGHYLASGRCIQVGFHLCAHQQFTCKEGTRCTSATCVPNDVPEYAVCSDQARWCNSGFRCIRRSNADTCISQADWLREQAQKSSRVREARRALLEWEAKMIREERLKIDRQIEKLLMAQHTLALADHAIEKASALVLARSGFKSGGAYYAGIRGISDVALGTRTPGQVLWEMGKTGALNKIRPGLGTATAVVETQYQYEQEWIRFYETRTK